MRRVAFLLGLVGLSLFAQTLDTGPVSHGRSARDRRWQPGPLLEFACHPRHLAALAVYWHSQRGCYGRFCEHGRVRRGPLDGAPASLHRARWGAFPASGQGRLKVYGCVIVDLIGNHRRIRPLPVPQNFATCNRSRRPPPRGGWSNFRGDADLLNTWRSCHSQETRKVYRAVEAIRRKTI
jgi:hypothetical protein